MKKYLIIAISGLALLGCKKKETTYQKDSNAMLSEPAVHAATDSAAKAKPTDQTTVATPAAESVKKNPSDKDAAAAAEKNANGTSQATGARVDPVAAPPKNGTPTK